MAGIAELFSYDYASEPAKTEQGWQDRRAELIGNYPDASNDAGDRYSHAQFYAMRETVCDDGAIRMKPYYVDEWGRLWIEGCRTL